MCEEAKLAGVDPHAYLLQATEAAIAVSGTVTCSDVLAAAAPAKCLALYLACFTDGARRGDTIRPDDAAEVRQAAGVLRRTKESA